MFHYLAPYVGIGTDDDAFRPRGSEQPGWKTIDLRADSTILTGRAIMAVPVRDDTIGAYLGDAPDEVSAAIKAAVQNRFGITLAATSLRHIIPELLIAHAREDGTRWRPLRAMHDGVFRIYLDGLWWQAKSLAGGSTITESFNTADSDTLGPDLSWTELVGDIDIVSNRAHTITIGSQCVARAEGDLATANHYAQASVNVSEELGTGSVGIITRKDSTATLTYYLQDVSYQADLVRLYKCVGGTFTQLVADVGMTLTAGSSVMVKGTVNGSSLNILIDGVSKNTATDTAIPGNLRTGIRGNKGTSGYVNWDSFEAGDLVVPGHAWHAYAQQ